MVNESSISSIFSYYRLFPNDVLFQKAGQSPAPSKDYYQLQIKSNGLIFWRFWKITSRNESAKFHPGEIKCTYEDFEHDERLRKDITRIFNEETLLNCDEIINKKLNILGSLNFELFSKLLRFLNLEDVKILSSVSKSLNKLCNDERSWRQLFIQHAPSMYNDDVEELGTIFGWKQLLFSSKLQIQRQIHKLHERLSQQSVNGLGDHEIESGSLFST